MPGLSPDLLYKYGDNAAVTALLDLHHAHVLKCGPRSWRTKLHSDLPQQQAAR